MQVELAGDFADNIFFLFRRIRPIRVLETGTYIGQGSTLLFSMYLHNMDITDAVVTTIEVNPIYLKAARANIEVFGMTERVEFRHGLTIPRDQLPSVKQIREEIDALRDENVPHDFPGCDDFDQKYFVESFFDAPEDDLLRRELEREPFPDVVLLDSAGHLGWREFEIFMRHARPCYLVLDDVNHIKHYRSLKYAADSDEFDIRAVGSERNGWAILEYRPRGR